MPCYILDEQKRPVRVAYDDPRHIAMWRGDGFERYRRVAWDEVGDVRVSTVFLGTAHPPYVPGKPTLWETMIFGGDRDQDQERYQSHEDAVAGHARIVAELKAASA